MLDRAWGSVHTACCQSAAGVTTKECFSPLPESCRGVCQQVPGLPSAKEKLLLCKSNQHWNQSPGHPMLRMCVALLAKKGLASSSQFKNVTENQEGGLRRAQMIQSLKMRPYKKRFENIFCRRASWEGLASFKQEWSYYGWIFITPNTITIKMSM